MSKVHVKINDNVYVLTGKDAGKSGKVLKIDAKSGRIIVEGVHMATKHKRPNMRNQTGGIIHQEASIDASSVMLVCPKCKRPSKVAHKILDNGEKLRVCKACAAVIDTISAQSKTKGGR